MPNMPAIRNILLKVVFPLAIVVVLAFGLEYLYSGPIFLQNRNIENLRLRVDGLLGEAHRNNFLFINSYYASQFPENPLWYPPRILYGPDQSEAAGEPVYGVYGEVEAWDPTTGGLAVYPYFGGVPDNEIVFEVSTDDFHTLVVMPDFDEEGRPYLSEQDRSFYTLEEAMLFASDFETTEELVDFVGTFENQEALTNYILDNYHLFPTPVQSREQGPYVWDTAFCTGDIIFVSFRDLETALSDEPEAVLADHVLLLVGGCPIDYAE